MDKQLISVGLYNKSFNSYLPYEIEYPAIYQSEGLNLLPIIQALIRMLKKTVYMLPHCIQSQTLNSGMAFKRPFGYTFFLFI